MPRGRARIATAVVGSRYGRLTTTGRSDWLRPSLNSPNREHWECLCDCGNVLWVRKSHICDDAGTRSCGCLAQDHARSLGKVQGGFDNPSSKVTALRYGTSYKMMTNHFLYPGVYSIWRGRKSWNNKNPKTRCAVGFNNFHEFAAYIISIIPIGNICPVLGIEMKRNAINSGPDSFSIDRINNDLPYQEGNIQIISHKANSMKRDATHDELVKFALWVLRTNRNVRHVA